MSSLYGPSYLDTFQPTSPSANRDENRRSFLDLNQPLTSMGRRQPSQIPAVVPNIYSPQPTFSPSYHPTTQNIQVASQQEFDRSEETHVPHDQDDRFRRQQPAGSIAYYVADSCCDSPLGYCDWDPSTPPVSATSTCGSFHLYNSAEGSVEMPYQFPSDDQFTAFEANDTFCDSYYGAANIIPYRSQHPPISPTQRSSYSELSANVRYLTELSAESKACKAASPPSEPKIQQTSTKAKRKERPSDSDLDLDFEPNFPSSSRRRSAPAPVKQKVAAAPPRPQSTAPPPKSHPPKKTEEQKRLSLACLFCRERKIACGRPSEDDPDQTCSQCLRRELTCEYPKESRRGQHKRGPKTTEKSTRR